VHVPSSLVSRAKFQFENLKRRVHLEELGTDWWIKTHIKELEREDVDWVHLAQDKVQW
jgi:hypothetical protein